MPAPPVSRSMVRLQDTNNFLGNPADGNRYAYAGDNPANYIDPTGPALVRPTHMGYVRNQCLQYRRAPARYRYDYLVHIDRHSDDRSGCAWGNPCRRTWRISPYHWPYNRLRCRIYVITVSIQGPQ